MAEKGKLHEQFSEALSTEGRKGLDLQKIPDTYNY